MAFFPIRFRLTGRLALALTVLLVTACAGPRNPAPPTHHQTQVSAGSGRAVAAPAPRPALPVGPGGGKTAALVPPPPPPVPDLSAHQLIGKGPDDLLAILGEPRLIRRDAPAEIWQYARPGCVLLLFLYESDADPLRVWYLEMHDGSVDLASLSPISQKACLQDFYLDSRQAKLTD